MVKDELMADSIELLGGDPGYHVRRHVIERFGREFAGAAHAFERICIMDADAARFGVEGGGLGVGHVGFRA